VLLTFRSRVAAPATGRALGQADSNTQNFVAEGRATENRLDCAERREFTITCSAEPQILKTERNIQYISSLYLGSKKENFIKIL
jgi:hypothetical protein